MSSSTQSADRPLFHYTTQTGLLGIIKDKCIRATHIRYLNDAAEHVYALELAKGLMKDALDEGKIESEAHRRMNSLLNAFAEAHVFVASFSKKGDLLSQWRGYCPEGSGVSLGFDMSTLGQVRTPFERVCFSLEQCIYDQDEQKDLLREAIRTWSEENRDCDDKPGQMRNSLAPVYALVRLSARLKHRSFCEEREWRLVSNLIPAGHACVAFREGRSVLTPYVELPLANPDGSMPLSKVTVGPAPHMDLSCQSTYRFLVSNGVKIDREQVAPSQIPYRSW